VRGAILSLLNRWDEAKESLDRSIGLFPDYAWALAVKAGVHVTIGEYEQAYADVVRSLELDDSFAWAWGLRAALIERRDGNVDEQQAAARRGVDLDGTDAQLRIVLADALARGGDLDTAGQTYQQVIEMFERMPTPFVDVDIQQAVAWARLRLRQPENALPHLGVAVARDAGRLDLGFDLGLVLMCLRRWTRAGTEYDTAVRRVRDEPHPGRRAVLLGDALRNIDQIRAQGTLPPGAEVDRVVDLLRTEIASGQPPRPDPCKR
jgi:tetratricopeptide (TPR) repeat protein